MALPTLEMIYISALFVEAALYGMLVACFVVSCYTLYRGNNRSGCIPCVFTMSILMFIVATIHIAVNSHSLLSGDLLKVRDPVTGDIIVPFATTSGLLRDTTFMLQTLLGNGFMLHRLCVVWNKPTLRWIVSAPFMASFLTCTALIIRLLSTYWSASNGLDLKTGLDTLRPDLAVQALVFFSLTLFTNLGCSILIGARVWWIYRRIQEPMIRISNLKRTAVIMAESGAVYTMSLIIFLGLYIARSLAYQIMFDVITQIVGITSQIILIRILLGVSTGDSQTKWDESTQSTVDQLSIADSTAL